MRFEFATATRIIFGKGTISEAAPEAAIFGKRAFVITGSSVSRAQHCIGQLADRGVHVTSFAVAGEPSVDTIQNGATLARHDRCDVVIGIGGGSVIDTGKAVAALITNPGEPLDYMEIIGKGRPLVRPAVPYIAIPTTAGTGAEVTKNAVIASPDHKIKASMRSPFMLPRLAIIDPELTYTLSPNVTAGTGLDAFTQCIEAYVSNKSTPVTDLLSRDGILRAARSLATACANGNDVAAREDMALASLLGGLSLANASLGAVHGFAAAIGGKYAAPHGTICALLLPHVMAANVAALTARSPDSAILDKFTSLARLLTNDQDASSVDAVQWIEKMCANLPVPHGASFHLTATAIPEIVAAAVTSSSMKGNPVVLTDNEMMNILEKAFGRVNQ
jgi:alcohol dehydrogenase class IV